MVTYIPRGGATFYQGGASAPPPPRPPLNEALHMHIRQSLERLVYTVVVHDAPRQYKQVSPKIALQRVR